MNTLTNWIPQLPSQPQSVLDEIERRRAETALPNARAFEIVLADGRARRYNAERAGDHDPPYSTMPRAGAR